MKFKLRPVLFDMEQMYCIPPSKKRFEKYLYMLQGKDKNDMVLPIGGYNPMGNDHFIQKLHSLITLDAEEIAKRVINEINKTLNEEVEHIFEVVINLADDIGGAWSHRFMTDYSSKFQIEPLLKRNFCTPYFWTSEDLNEILIARRIRAYIYRTCFQINNGPPLSLEDHIAQEIFVEKRIASKRDNQGTLNLERLTSFYEKNYNSEDYGLIFNFLYGDDISKSLGYKTYGCKMGEASQFIVEMANTKV